MNSPIEKMRNAAAKFFKADFHVHSPLSHDWSNTQRPNYTPNPYLSRISSPDLISRETLDAYLGFVVNSGIDIIAITDHMKFSFGVALTAYALEKKKNILVLPGIELNVRFTVPILNEYRIHLLAIFPPEIGKTKIDSIFPPDFKDESNRNGHDDEVPYDSIDTVTQKIRALNGRVIAAHIYNTNGLRLAFTNQASLILKPIEKTEPAERLEMYRKVGESIKNELAKMDGLQVTESTNPVHFCDDEGKLFVPLVLSSDAHHVMDIGAADKITYLKLGELNYDCLCEAFKIPDTRIRFPKNLPEIKPPRLRGIRIIGQKGNPKSYFHDFSVGFSNNLTCIVGPRGSGKSALIDAIRYAMGYNRTLSDIEKVRQQVLDRQRFTLQATKIELLYERMDASIHLLSATYDEKENYNTTVFDLDNNQINISDVEKSGEYPLNLYGWNELELLGEDPRSQRESLDRFIKELKALKEQKEDLYNLRRATSKKCIDSVIELDTFFQAGTPKNQFLRVKEFETEFNRLNSPEMEKRFKDLDVINQKLGLIEIAKTELDSLKIKLEDIKSVDFSASLAKFPLIEEWGQDFLSKIIDVNGINETISRSRLSITEKIDLVNELISREETLLLENKSQAAKGIRETIGDDQSISADLRNNAKKRWEQAKAQLEAYKKELELFEKRLSEREAVLTDLEKVSAEIYAVRKGELDNIASKIQVVNDDGFKISLSLVQGNDRVEFLGVLEKNACGIPYDGQWKKKKIPMLISHKLNPIELGRVFLKKDADSLVIDLDVSEDDTIQTYSIPKTYAETFLEKCCPFESLPDINLKKVDKEKLERAFILQATKFDDEFFIRLNGKPIQFCSPGQRCSAMLPIVTLTSDAPIIIDQPEDNLDNRLVSRAIFKILSKLKETRQIIVATHNPNILVSGDSEQVVVLKGSGEIENYGSIDSPPIIRNVIELMEGGKDAFEKRRMKYEIV